MDNNNNEEERPKRLIAKPVRYQTTSSEEEPSRKKRKMTGRTVETMEDSIAELRATLEGNSSILYNQHSSTHNTYSPSPYNTQQTITHYRHTSTYIPHNIHTSTPTTHATTCIQRNIHTSTPITHIPFTHTQNISGILLGVLSSTGHELTELHPPIHGRQQDPGCIFDESRNPEIRALHARMDGFETMLQIIHGLLEDVSRKQDRILVGQRQQQQQRGIPEKPAALPIRSVAAMGNFQSMDDTTYQNIVNYFEFIGGFTLKEAINLCFREAFTDEVLEGYSWLGREGRRLCDSRMLRAIHAAVSRSKNFEKLTKSAVAQYLKSALRTAKERLRSRRRGPQQRGIEDHLQDQYWEQEDGEDD